VLATAAQDLPVPGCNGGGEGDVTLRNGALDFASSDPPSSRLTVSEGGALLLSGVTLRGAGVGVAGGILASEGAVLEGAPGGPDSHGLVVAGRGEARLQGGAVRGPAGEASFAVAARTGGRATLAGVSVSSAGGGAAVRAGGPGSAVGVEGGSVEGGAAGVLAEDGARVVLRGTAVRAAPGHPQRRGVCCLGGARVELHACAVSGPVLGDGLLAAAGGRVLVAGGVSVSGCRRFGARAASGGRVAFAPGGDVAIAGCGLGERKNC